MDRLRVAVIDTGIDPSHPGVAEVVGGAGLSIGADGAVAFGDDPRDLAGHGTACAGVASRGLSARIELLAIRVVDDRGGSTVRLLEAAIPWAVGHGARVINISLGAPIWQEDARERLRAVCAEAVRRGVIVIAAAGPDGTRALPAVLDEVIAVGSAICPPDILYVADEEHLDFLARGDLQRVPWIGGQTVLGQGTSLAAAHVTNAVCKILLRAPALDAAGVRAALAAQAIQGAAASRGEWRRRADAFYRGRTPARASFLRRVALYPFNKEIHALVRFRAELPFTIAAVADPPGKRLSGRDAASVLGDPPANLPIHASFERALDDADSVILGHLEAIDDGLLRQLVTRAVERGKGVFSLSRLGGPELAEVRALAERRGVPCADPTVTRAEVAPLFGIDAEPGLAPDGGEDLLRDPRLRAHGRTVRRRLRGALVHDCPVLGVFGTSRAQGKFSLQLGLRATLSQMGYRVAHLATEPTGMLLGATATLPTGYERGDDLTLEETSYLVHLLSTEIKNRERPDLLLVGSQSSAVTVSPDLYRLGLGTLGTLALGAAAQPDACVLVCNPEDPPDHVQRCRAAIESVLHSRVIAAAFGDQVWEHHAWRGVRRRRLARLDEGALRDRLGGWEKSLGVPCCPVLSAEGRARLGELVVEHFASAAAPDLRQL
jgi:uncharacterized NAD-dependent epimerase/dehydratase family protein